MVEPRAFILLGSDEIEKQKHIELLQKKIFPPGLKDLNYTSFYGDEKQLTLRELREALACLPTQGARQRLVVIKMAHKLKKPEQECLIREIQSPENKTVVVLDVPVIEGAEAFVEKFSKVGARVVRFKSEIAPNVFELGSAFLAHRAETALRILSGLLAHREKAEKIVGAIFWQWEYLRSNNRFTDDVYRKGVNLILEADKRLKSSSSAYARETLILEALMVKLSFLT